MSEMQQMGVVLPNGKQVNAPTSVWLAALLQSLGEAKMAEICSLVESMTVTRTPIIGGGQNGISILSRGPADLGTIRNGGDGSAG